MKTKITIILGIILSAGSLFAQNHLSLDLTFTAVDNTANVKLDSVYVMNMTESGGNMIYWPDTTINVNIVPGDSLLYIGYITGYPVGIPNRGAGPSDFMLSPCMPNPVTDKGSVNLYLPETGTVVMQIVDVMGRVVFSRSLFLEKGVHQWLFTPGSGRVSFVTALWNGYSRITEILSTGNAGSVSCRLEYAGNSAGGGSLKSSPLKQSLIAQESGILDAPQASKTVTFQFATNIPCPGTPTVTYGGQVYNTIQIFSQCWLAENLNVGTMISGSQDMSDNGILEKYCYDDSYLNCDVYGGLYQWDEMMQYTTQPGAQGICPQGWHLPSDDEWKVLAGAVDSQYGIGDPVWEGDWVYAGYDVGFNLKADHDWDNDGEGVDLYGFSALPGGGEMNGNSGNKGILGIWFTSSERPPDAWGRNFSNSSNQIQRTNNYKAAAFSVRCMKNN